MEEAYEPIFRNQRSINQPLMSGGNAITGGNAISAGNQPAFQPYSNKIGKHVPFQDRAKTTIFPRYTANQQGLINQIIQQAQQGMQNPYEGFQPIMDEAMSDFYSKTVPTLAERFTSMGQGASRSSAFQGALAEGGAELHRGLAAEKSRYGLQNKSILNQLMGIGLQPSFESTYTPGGPDAAGKAVGTGIGLLSKAAGFVF